MASAALSAPSQPAPATPRLPTPPQTARRSLRRAVWRNPKSLPPSLCVRGERANPGSTAARHAHGIRSRCVLPDRTSPTACPPPCTLGAPCATSPQRHEPHGCRCIMPLRTHTHSAARGPGGASPIRASYGMLLLLWRTLWRTSLAAPQPLLPARILMRRQTCFEGAWYSSHMVFTLEICLSSTLWYATCTGTATHTCAAYAPGDPRCDSQPRFNDYNWAELTCFPTDQHATQLDWSGSLSRESAARAREIFDLVNNAVSSGEPLPHYAVDRVNYYDPKYAMATLPADRNCNDGGNCWADFPHNITIRQSCDLPGDVEIVAEDLDPSYPSYDPTMGPLFRQNVRPLFSQSPPFHDYVSHCGSVSQGDVKMPFVGCGHGYCIPSLGPLPVCSMGRDCYRSLGPSKCHCMGNWDTTTDCRTCLPDWHGADCEIKFTPPSPPPPPPPSPSPPPPPYLPPPPSSPPDIALVPSTILADQSSELTLQGAGASDGDTFVFLPASVHACSGALTESFYGGGVVAGNHVSIRLAERGVYKLCIAARAHPMSDSAFSVATGVLLLVTMASPPPPPPPVHVIASVSESEGPLDTFATVIGTMASTIAVAGALRAAFIFYRRRRRRSGQGNLLSPVAPRSESSPPVTVLAGTEITQVCVSEGLASTANDTNEEGAASVLHPP